MFTVSEKCNRCGLCAELCLTGIIDFDRANGPSVPEKMEGICIGCGECVSFCPANACYLSCQSKEDRGPLDTSKMPAAEEAEVLLRSRRSVRRYKEKPVADATVRRIIETARYAPSAVNSQPVRWVVTRTREKTLEIAALVIDFFRKQLDSNPNLKDAAKISRIISQWDSGKDVVFRGAPQLAAVLMDRDYFENRFREDGAMALTYFELAAHANGVGCCWAGFFTIAARNDPRVASAVGAKENEIVSGGQMFGHPKGLKVPEILPPRKAPDITWL